MPSVERILIRGVNWLGDAVMTTPALMRLRAAQPQAEIVLFTHAKLAGLWPGHPAIDRLLTFSSAEGVFGAGRRLRSEHFGSAVIFPNSFRSAFETFLARVPKRIGYARNGRNFLLTQSLAPRPGAVRMHKRSAEEVAKRIADKASREILPATAHHAHDYLNLVTALGAKSELLPTRLHIDDEEVLTVRTRFELKDDSPLFALNAGAEYGPAKRWPSERFVEAAIELHQRTRCRWIVLGGQADRELAQAITSEILKQTKPDTVMNLAGETSLRELCAVLKASALLLTNDTGPMHVAAALGTPVVVPFGSTAPELTGPIPAPHSRQQLLVGDAPCAPCFLRECPIDFRCMKAITVDQVVASAMQAWKLRPDA